MIRFLVDSSCDLNKDYLEENNIRMVSLKVNIDGKEYLDGVDLDRNAFYEILTTSEVFPKTSQPSPQSYVDFFEEVKENGDECICIMLSSGLSGTYQAAVLAKDIVDYDKIHVIDSKSVSCGIQLLVEEAKKMISEGKNVNEIVDRLEELKKRIRIYLSVDSLEYLYRGGRLDKASYVIGGLANIKPLIAVNEEGKIDVITKVIGAVKVMRVMQERIQADQPDTNYPIYSAYTSGTNNVEKLEIKLQRADITVNHRIQLGPTIGSHVGPEAFAVVFIAKER